MASTEVKLTVNEWVEIAAEDCDIQNKSNNKVWIIRDENPPAGTATVDKGRAKLMRAFDYGVIINLGVNKVYAYTEDYGVSLSVDLL